MISPFLVLQRPGDKPGRVCGFAPSAPQGLPGLFSARLGGACPCPRYVSRDQAVPGLMGRRRLRAWVSFPFPNPSTASAHRPGNPRINGDAACLEGLKGIGPHVSRQHSLGAAGCDELACLDAGPSRGLGPGVVDGLEAHRVRVDDDEVRQRPNRGSTVGVERVALGRESRSSFSPS